jgi:hypothetical protein
MEWTVGRSEWWYDGMSDGGGIMSGDADVMLKDCEVMEEVSYEVRGTSHYGGY